MGDPMNKMLGNQVILTTDDIRQWQEEIAAAERAKVAAEATIADRRKKLDAAAIFGFTLDHIASEPEDDSETMRDAVVRILGGFDRPVEHRVLQSELRKVSRFAEMLSKHKSAYYYTLIKRLADETPPKIKKVGKKIRLVPKTEPSPEEAKEDGL
jgi:hypothetical protein